MKWIPGLLMIVGLVSACGGEPLELASDGSAFVTVPDVTSATKQLATTAIDGTMFNCPATTLQGTPQQKLHIVVPSSLPLIEAAEDLRRDLQNRLGPDSVEIASQLDANHTSIIVSIGGYPTVTPAPMGPEGHQIARYQTGAGGSARNHVLLRGADLRGTIYAIYTFSEKVLGVPPLWFWAYGNREGYFPEGQPPGTNSTLTVPANSCRLVAPPETKYRGAFLNDHHFFSRWAAGAQRPGRLDLFFETLLRLKLNVVHGLQNFDSNPDGSMASTKALDTFRAHDRGLIAVRDWGSNGAWRTWMLGKGYVQDQNMDQKVDEEDVPAPNLDPMCTNRSQSRLVEFWTESMNRVIDGRATYTFDNTMWYLGLRAYKDGDDPWADLGLGGASWTTKANFEINTMLCQLELLKEKVDPQMPKAAIHMWSNIDELYRNSSTFRAALAPGGVLDGLTATFANDIRTRAPSAAVSGFTVQTDAFAGYYHNLQFTSTGSHVVDGGGPWKAVQSFKYVRSRAGTGLRYGMMNVGSFRSFLLSASVVADLMWDVSGYPTSVDSGVQEVLEIYFPGNMPQSPQPSYGQVLTTLYKEFLEAYWEQDGTPSTPPIDRQWIWEDLRHYQSMRKLLDGIEASSALGALMSSDSRYFGIDLVHLGEPSEAEAIYHGLSISSGDNGSVYRWRQILNRTAGNQLDLGDVENTLDTNPELFQAMFEAPIRAVIESARANYYVAVARKRKATNNPSGVSSDVDNLEDAIGALDNMGSELDQAEYGEFAAAHALTEHGWFDGDPPPSGGGSYHRCSLRDRIKQVLCGLSSTHTGCVDSFVPADCME